MVLCTRDMYRSLIIFTLHSFFYKNMFKIRAGACCSIVFSELLDCDVLNLLFILKRTFCGILRISSVLANMSVKAKRKILQLHRKHMIQTRFIQINYYPSGHGTSKNVFFMSRTHWETFFSRNFPASDVRLQGPRSKHQRFPKILKISSTEVAN